MNCLGATTQAVSVIIDISDMSNVQPTYSQTQSSFEALRDGKYTLLAKEADGTYMLLVKENRTACYFDVVATDGLSDARVVRRVAFFDELPLTEEDIQLYQDPVPQIPTC